MINEEKKKYFEKFVERNMKRLIECQNLGLISDLFPIRVHIEPTNACNLRCIHCHHNNTGTSRQYSRKLGFMEMSVYKKTIDEIKAYGCEITLDNQGEPLLHPQIIEMVEYAKRNNIFVSILTNATRLSDDISRKLIDLKLDRIVFSFDSIIKDEYEKIRVNAKFESVLYNILNFIKLNYEAGMPTFVTLSNIPQKRNENSYNEFKDFFESIPINNIYFSSLLTVSGFSGISDEVNIDELSADYNQLKPVCRIPWESIVVNYDGLVNPCPLDVNVLYSAGNVKENSLKEIWNSETYQKFRKAHLYNDLSIIETNEKLCSSCNGLYDFEYNIKNYSKFFVRDITRKADQIFTGQKIDYKTKYDNLLAVLNNYPESFYTYSDNILHDR